MWATVGISQAALTSTDAHVLLTLVDMGAYEFYAPALNQFIVWLEFYDLPTDGSADWTDPDGDLSNTWHEWRCHTDPTNALSALRLLPPQPSNSDIVLTWESFAGAIYFLERSTNLSSTPAFQPLAGNLRGKFGTTTYVDTNAAPDSPRFYRVGVSN